MDERDDTRKRAEIELRSYQNEAAEFPPDADDLAEWLGHMIAAYDDLAESIDHRIQGAEERERIVKAACRYSDGSLRIGRRHSDCLYERGECMAEDVPDQGFLTSEGRFVDRYKAAEIAWAARQIDRWVNRLYSEDIW